MERAREDDPVAFAMLSERYMSVLHGRAGRYSSIAGVDTEDFVQEGLFALYRAVKGFNPDAGIQFRTYAITCINNSMTSAIRSHMRDFRQHDGIPLDAVDEHKLYLHTAQQAGDRPVEDMYMQMEAADYREQQIEALLSDFERQVLRRYLSEKSYQEIAEALRTTTKAVDNALQRVRRKLRPEL